MDNGTTVLAHNPVISKTEALSTHRRTSNTDNTRSQHFIWKKTTPATIAILVAAWLDGHGNAPQDGS